MSALVVLGNIAVLVALVLAWRALWLVLRDYLGGRWGGSHTAAAVQRRTGGAYLLPGVDEEPLDDGDEPVHDPAYWQFVHSVFGVELPADDLADDGIRVHS